MKEVAIMNTNNESRLLNTIQKSNKLNDVLAVDQPGPGHANHKYIVMRSGKHDVVQEIGFQKGPRNDETSVSGVLDTDLLEIVRDRLQGFQSDVDLSCRENAIALTHIEDALLWLNKRVEDRASRGVLGTNKK